MRSDLTWLRVGGLAPAIQVSQKEETPCRPIKSTLRLREGNF